MEKNVQLKYRLYRRSNGVFYWQENDSSKQGTLHTSDRREAERLLNAMNESHRQPTINLNLARAYLAAHDPKMAQRTWQAVMDEMATHGIPSTQTRCARAFRSKAYDPIRRKSLVQTTGEDLLTVLHMNGNCVAHYLRRLHNLALDLGWLPCPILAKRAWPKIRSQSKRAITAEEHAAVIASEKNTERRAYYEVLYETGPAQTDAANLSAEDIDWDNGLNAWHCTSDHVMDVCQELGNGDFAFLNVLGSLRLSIAFSVSDFLVFDMELLLWLVVGGLVGALMNGTCASNQIR
jgi:hypothetical protein